GIATHPFLFAVNRCARNAPLTSFDVACALQAGSVFELPDGGPEVGELLCAGAPLELIEARNSLCLQIEQMLIDLLPAAQDGHSTLPAPRHGNGGFLPGRRRKRVACL
ncbi:MAG: hypothetical protein LBG81_00860, partial [Coriobacteriaceae bacterium]|nr:hypothetical protein [Coriobacteriaceae bacterium]